MFVRCINLIRTHEVAKVFSMPFPLPFRALLTDHVEEVLPINRAIIFNYNCCQQLLRIAEFLFVSGAFLISSEHGDVKG